MRPEDDHSPVEPASAAAREQRAPLTFWVFPAALALGVLGDLLLRARPYGLNAALWAVATLACAAGLLYWRERRLTPWTTVFLAASAAFALCLAWRDSAYLKWLAAGCSLVSAALAAGVVGGLAPASGTFLEYFSVLLRGARRILFGGWRTLTAADPGNWPVDALRKPWLAALLRGLLLAIPVLAVFTLLFASADDAFGDLITKMFSFDRKSLPRPSAAFALSAYLAGGLLCTVVAGVAQRLPREKIRQRIQTSGIEAAVVFAAVDALFLAFVVVQFQYFFGGSGRIESVAELTYAEYARRGFSELCTVAVLTLLVQYFFHWLSQGARPREKTICRLLSVLMLLLVAVIMVSALMRMRLYVEAYGLTELRFYSTAFMAWIGLSLAWFAVTALWGRTKRFALGMVLSGLVFVMAFHVMNPGQIIVSRNLARISEGKDFDERYALQLGDDAIPAIVAALGTLPEDDAKTFLSRLADKSSYNERHTGWRRWNWSRSKAYKLLDDLYHSAAVEDAAEDPPKSPH